MQNLGLIPSWQFVETPTRQPLNGLGFIPSWQFTETATGQPLGDPIETMNAVFNSWWWRHRQLLVVGGAALLALGVVGGISAITR